MAITKSIGKNTLGSGNKMTVDLRTYNRSTHNLSYAWRSSMGVGTLVPCMKIPALPGDTFDINIDKKVLTHPTVGPLFGSYKMQVDIFTCPMRLYMSGLHNNMLNVGLNMAQIKVPKLNITMRSAADTPSATNPWSQINPSSLLAYLGLRGISLQDTAKTKNALPLLSYLDIFKNYYANKQEEMFYAVMPINAELLYILKTQSWKPNDDTNTWTFNANITISPYSGLTTDLNTAKQNTQIQVFIARRENGRTIFEKNETMSVSEFQSLSKASVTLESNTLKISATNINTDKMYSVTTAIKPKYGTVGAALKSYDLNSLDELREKILQTPPTEELRIGTQTLDIPYISDLFGRYQDAPGNVGVLNMKNPQSGLILKTYQSDIFNNWINTEWIDGDNGISSITAIDTSSGEFTIDTLNLAKKVYDMLNRIAVSGGSYRDWIETVYTGGYMMHTETPVYEGGMSCEIEFQEVVSNSATEDEPLGTLAGRGVDTSHKGGNLHIKVNEPCYIIGIVSITPRVDYCQGNDWDLEVTTMDDWHKPQLDGIGFQDLKENLMAWWRPDNATVGKQPAWINYMTNFNKTYGNFAIEGNEAFMVLNRYYDPKDGNYSQGEIDYTTYIDPSKYNYVFAETNIEAQNFWVQLGFGIKARRVMSAKQIPNL